MCHRWKKTGVAGQDSASGNTCGRFRAYADTLHQAHGTGLVPPCKVTDKFGELGVAEEQNEKLHGREGVSSRRKEAKATVRAAVKQQRQSALFDELSGAEEEEESLKEGLRVEGRGKRPLPEEENEDAGATEKKASRMSTKTLDKMIWLLKSMAQDGADNTFESSSDDGELGGESAAESDVEDMFKVEALPLATRGWTTEQTRPKSENVKLSSAWIRPLREGGVESSTVMV